MSFSVGIIGLPNVGKSTLFKALTRQPVDISNYPFCTIDPNFGIVKVPDERLQKLAEVLNPPKVTPTVIEFVDIAGLVRGAHKGEGLGNQFLSHIQEVDAILEVVRAFEDPEIQHVEKIVDPGRDIEIIKNELLMRDLKVLEKIAENLSSEAKSGEKEAIRNLGAAEKLKEILEKNKLPSEEDFNDAEKEFIKTLGFLTIKPTIYLFNVKENLSTDSAAAKLVNPVRSQTLGASADTLVHPVRDFISNGASRTSNGVNKFINLDLKLEEEISELSDAETKELNLQSKIPELIKLCYEVLNLITFYTIKGGEELRAWTLKYGLCAPDAGGVVHSDFQEKFIRAEVIQWEGLCEIGSWARARQAGQIKTVGKDYIVEDGDIIEFKI